MRRARFASLAGLCALGSAAAAALAPSNASGGWPPPESATAADLADPANWPNDPAYGYSNDSSGQWGRYGFVPMPSGNVMPLPQETAAGMSIDLAWRLTIGDPHVRIAIADSGILWNDTDLLDQAWINRGELSSHKPLRADGTPCGGVDDLAGFDCNGDGILTVSDYTDTPSLHPDASSGHPRGDRNANGQLDAGDLILNFSDGIDDDGNGYVDDIAGWDFFQNDNDPYDDTANGHGTEGAKASVAQANNSIDGAGGCPHCRFIPLRVSDSSTADTHDLAKAIVYAADAGAVVVQSAVSTVDNAGFVQTALDYAYGKEALVITSMANEGSRHHSVPATNNHTLPVHGVQFDGDIVTRSTTFLAAQPCSNFGGQGLLSASSSGCSGEAAAELAGVAGLLYSAALKYQIPLSPGEAQSLLFGSTDDVDVPASQLLDALYGWSQPGFDQRFGYGRVNANRAVEAIRDKRIPPSVDITSPRWFQVLYKDQVKESIRIEGLISAKRADSYDYSVEWGPGVQPLDAEFKMIQQETNVPATTAIGKAGPLASFDIRTVDTSHARDVDSTHGENDLALTVRVRATAHYGGPVGDVRGEMRRTYYVHSDPSLVTGFPVYVGDSGEGSPKMADLDGDGARELIYPTSGGLLYVLQTTRNGPQALAGFPFKTNLIDGFVRPPPTPRTPSYLGAPAYTSGAVSPELAREAIVGAPAIGDIDGDGKDEIVISTWAGTVYVIRANGQLAEGWPLRLPEVPSCPLDPSAPQSAPCASRDAAIARGASASPVLADLDGDGRLDVIQASFDGKVYAFDAAGVPLNGWPVDVHYAGNLSAEPARARILTTPAVADFNGDGLPDLLVGSNERLGDNGQSGAVYLLDARGTNAPGGDPVLPSWPVTMTSLRLLPLIAEGTSSSGVIGRFEGTLAAVVHGNGAPPWLLPATPTPQQRLGDTPANALPPARKRAQGGLDPSTFFGLFSLAKTAGSMVPLLAQPSLGDIDQDGVPDVIASGGSPDAVALLQGQRDASLGAATHLLAVWSGSTGRMLPGSPFVIEDHTLFNSQAVADLTGDDYPEVLTGSGGYFLHAFDGCGREPRGFPKFTGQWIATTPAIGDIDGDGRLEVAVGTRNGWLFAWHTEAAASSIVEWESIHHDNRNTGNLESPLGQGAARKAAHPLTAAMCSEPSAETPLPLRAGGGFTCALASIDDTEVASGPSALVDGRGLAALTVIAAWARRRRRIAA